MTRRVTISVRDDVAEQLDALPARQVSAYVTEALRRRQTYVESGSFSSLRLPSLTSTAWKPCRSQKARAAVLRVKTRRLSPAGPACILIEQGRGLGGVRRVAGRGVPGPCP